MTPTNPNERFSSKNIVILVRKLANSEGRIGPQLPKLGARRIDSTWEIQFRRSEA
jgi:hypothetical protein